MTELFGSRGGAAPWLLLAAAALGFMLTGVRGVWLTQRALERVEMRSNDRP